VPKIAQTTLQWEKFYPSHMAIIFELGQVEAPPAGGDHIDDLEKSHPENNYPLVTSNIAMENDH